MRGRSAAKKLLHVLLIGGLTAALFLWFLKGVDLGALKDRVKQAHLGYLLLGLGFAQGHFLLRAWRWRYLLLPVGEASFASRLNAVTVGYAANNLMPARAGEVARPFLLARRADLPFSATLATVVLERLLDAMTVAFLFLAAAPFVLSNRAGSSESEEVSLLKPILILGTLVLFVAIGWLSIRLAGGSLRQAGGKLLLWAPARVRTGIEKSAATFLTGFSSLGHGRVLAFVLGASLILWVEVSLAIWATARAFEIPLSVPGSLFVTGWLAVGMAAPTPAGLGGYHAACRYALTVFFAVEATLAAGIALVMHALSVVPVTLWGLIVLWKEGMDLGAVLRSDPEAVPAELPDPTRDSSPQDSPHPGD